MPKLNETQKQELALHIATLKNLENKKKIINEDIKKKKKQ